MNLTMQALGAPAALSLAVGLASAACLTDEGEGSIATVLEKIAGADDQQAPVGGRLPSALRVVARGGDGTAVPRTEVRWTVVSGEGAVLSDSSTVADGTGTAQVDLVLGPAEGTYGVRAAVAADPVVSSMFTAHAVPGPTLGSVSPQVFAAGDVITVQGGNFTAQTGFEIEGLPVPVSAGTLSATQVSLVVPPCLAPGAVMLQAVEAGARSTPLTGTFTVGVDPITLVVAEYISVRPSEIPDCATFAPAGPGGAEYLIVPQSVTSIAGDFTSYRLGGRVAMTPAPPRRTAGPDAVAWAMRFHDFLRARERSFAAGPGAGPPRAGLTVTTQLVKVGHRRDFVVCNDIQCLSLEDFSTVRAEAMFVGNRAAIYQDVNAPGGFTTTDFQSLGQLFDEDLYEVATRAFGAESDVDNNGLVLILLTPVVNALTPQEQCSDSFITGFFFGIDVSSAFKTDERSNQAEIFYAITPDPSGTVTCDFAPDQVRRIVPVTFIHEFQHMISFNQHVLLRNSRSEALWLNEGMSHLSEELGALHFRDVGDETQFSRFVIGDLANAYRYLESPGTEFVLPAEGTGSIPERGASWLFLRWLTDQFGEGVVRRLSETRLTSSQNVEAATGESMSRLLTEWFLSNWVSDLPDFVAPPRLQYTTWSFRTTFESLNQQASGTFPNPFPIDPPIIIGSGFERVGTLKAGSGEYVIVRQPPGDPGFSLAFTEPSGAALTAEAKPRLNILRIE